MGSHVILLLYLVWDYWRFTIVILASRIPWFCFKPLTGFSGEVCQGSSRLCSGKRLSNSLSPSLPCFPLSGPSQCCGLYIYISFSFFCIQGLQERRQLYPGGGVAYTALQSRRKRSSSLSYFWPEWMIDRGWICLTTCIMVVEFITGTVSVRVGTGICLEQIARWIFVLTKVQIALWLFLIANTIYLFLAMPSMHKLLL